MIRNTCPAVKGVPVVSDRVFVVPCTFGSRLMIRHGPYPSSRLSSLLHTCQSTLRRPTDGLVCLDRTFDVIKCVPKYTHVDGPPQAGVQCFAQAYCARQRRIVMALESGERDKWRPRFADRNFILGGRGNEHAMTRVGSAPPQPLRGRSTSGLAIIC